jgi:hypothetical protein
MIVRAERKAASSKTIVWIEFIADVPREEFWRSLAPGRRSARTEKKAGRCLSAQGLGV